MEAFIKSAVLTIERVYSDERQLELPWFQRAYAWGEVHVGRLVRDIVEAMASEKRRYSLGHMSLARPAGARIASIIDGHQRSITLTILFALLRDLLERGQMSDRLHALIEARDGSGYRLIPQPNVAEFFASYVQKRGAALIKADGDIMGRSPHEINILDNRDHLCGLLRRIGRTPAKLEDFARFLLERCVIIVDELEDEEEARLLLTREEERGLSPHSSEVAKVTILTAMPREEQEEGAGIFEAAQALLSADDMSNLLGHIRVLAVRRRSSKAVDGELIKQFQLKQTGLPFLRDELLPRAEMMARLLARNVGEGEARASISGSLQMLSWLGNQMWMPAALHWLKQRGEHDPSTALFFARLDRLTYLMRIGSVDPTDQEERLLELLEAIDKGAAVEAMAPLDIEPKLTAEVLENLRSRNFYYKRFHALVLRRISIIMSPGNDPGQVDGKNVTVEHVYPRNPQKGQLWLEDFPDKDSVAEYSNRIGNLAFLTLKMNNAAGNADFKLKQLFLGTGKPVFVLSANAAAEKAWTPATIMRRGEELIAILLKPWGLSP